MQIVNANVEGDNVTCKVQKNNSQTGYVNMLLPVGIF